MEANLELESVTARSQRTRCQIKKKPDEKEPDRRLRCPSRATATGAAPSFTRTRSRSPRRVMSTDDDGADAAGDMLRYRRRVREEEAGSPMIAC
ncbi:hypothetical protein BRADI_1g06601v3 [Brachypodium distachyon]|nr:hypothetical protein BRADI_1g06601v3 [Brachypodium distachyon]